LHDAVGDYSGWARFRLLQFARLPFRLAEVGVKRIGALFARLDGAGENE
jgi:hypothetical protein